MSIRWTMAVVTTAVLLLTACGGEEDDSALPDAPGDDATAEDAEAQDDAGDDATAEDAEAQDDPGAGDGDDPVRVGVTTLVTGPTAFVGTFVTEGARMAAAELNEEGGLLGREVVVVVEDDEGTPTGGTSSINRLLYSHNVDVVFGPDYSGVCLASLDLTAEAEMLQFGSCLSPRVTREGGNDYFFRIRRSDAVSAEAMVSYAMEDHDPEPQNIGLFSWSGEFGADNVAEVREVLADGYGIEPVVEETWELDDRDFSGQLRAFQNADVDTIFMCGLEGEQAVIARQMSLEDYDPTVLVCASASTPTYLELAEGFSDGWIVGAAWVPEMAEIDDNSRGFVDRYTERFNKDRPSSHAAAYYDGVKLWAQAVEAAGTTESDAVRDALLDLEYDGVLGTFRPDESGEMLDQDLLAIIRGDSYEAIGLFPAE